MKDVHLTHLVDPEQSESYNGYTILASSNTATVFKDEEENIDYLCMYKKNRQGMFVIYLYSGEFDEMTMSFSIDATVYKSFPMAYADPNGIKKLQADLIANLFNLEISNISFLSRVLLGYFPTKNIVNTINLDSISVH